jgi:hypothetical protein
MLTEKHSNVAVQYVYIYLSFIRDLLKLNKVLYQMSACLFYKDYMIIAPNANFVK